jgi:hypothetical protein
MMYGSPSGYILDIGQQAFYADGKNNDASIFVSQTQNPKGNMNFAKPGDFIVWDRGFRDANVLARQLGFSVHMPCFLQPGQKQHTNEEANKSRMVTKKIRHIVEGMNKFFCM